MSTTWNDEKVIEGEVVEHALEPVGTNHGSVTLFGTDDPHAIIGMATEKAKALADVIRQQKLTAKIGKREHVLIEGWTLLGSLLGVFPVPVWTREIRDEDGKLLGFSARVEARTLAGEVVGAAESRCLKAERNWSDRDDYALESMAQTRATSKALRMPLGFVMVLAGYNATPAEEITEAETDPPPKPKTSPAQDSGTGAPTPPQPVSESAPSKDSMFPVAPKDCKNHEMSDKKPDGTEMRAGWLVCRLCGTTEKA